MLDTYLTELDCEDFYNDKDEYIMELNKFLEENGTWDSPPKGYFDYCDLEDKDNDEF